MFRLIRLVILAAIAIAVASWISESRGDAPPPTSNPEMHSFAGENS